MFRANIYAGWFEADIDAVRTVIAFRSGLSLRLHVKRVVRTRLRAGFAADAAPIVEVDDPVLAGKECRDRTDLDAWSVGTMITPHHGKQAPRVGKGSLFDILDPSAVNADGDFMLGLAGNGAGVTAYAFPIVDNEAEVHRQVTRKRKV
jgi:hypothetical protein